MRRGENVSVDAEQPADGFAVDVFLVERARQCFAADGDRGERTIVETRAKRIVQRKIVVLVACPVGDFLRHTVGQVLAYRFGCAVFPGTADVDFLSGDSTLDTL